MWCKKSNCQKLQINPFISPVWLKFKFCNCIFSHSCNFHISQWDFILNFLYHEKVLLTNMNKLFYSASMALTSVKVQGNSLISTINAESINLLHGSLAQKPRNWKAACIGFDWLDNAAVIWGCDLLWPLLHASLMKPQLWMASLMSLAMSTLWKMDIAIGGSALLVNLKAIRKRSMRLRVPSTLIRSIKLLQWMI